MNTEEHELFNPQRRKLLKQGLVASTAVMLFPRLTEAMQSGELTQTGIATSIKVPADYPGPSDRYLTAIQSHYPSLPDIQEQHVQLMLPSLAENGNSVLLKVGVNLGGQSSSLHVTSIRIFAENNPLPEVAFFEFGPDSLPQVTTRIRLSASQIITAIATLSDGSHCAGSAYTTITLPACVEAFV